MHRVLDIGGFCLEVLCFLLQLVEETSDKPTSLSPYQWHEMLFRSVARIMEIRTKFRLSKQHYAWLQL